jgi:hypothetical protein
MMRKQPAIGRARSRRLRPAAQMGMLAVLATGLAVLALPAARAEAVVTVKATADSYVRSDQPDTNFGSKYVLDAEASSATTPAQVSYLQFTVSGFTQPPASVQLQLYSYAASATGLQIWTASGSWSEAGITYNNAPPLNQTMVGAIPNISTNTWASLDVSNVVTGNGSYTFAITTTSTANKQLASREVSASAPKLVIQTSASPPTISATNGSGQTATVGTAFGQPLVATVTDGSGSPVSNAQVTFTAPTAGASGTFAGGAAAVSVFTDTAGIATSPALTANSVAGSYTVTATTSGVTVPATFALTNGSTTTATSSPASSTPPATPSPTPTASPTPTGGTTTTSTFPMSADSYVRSDQPDTNFGKAYNLSTEAGSSSTPTITSYVMVPVSGLSGTVVSASLQLYSYATSSLGIKVWSAPTGWTETGITYNNAPAVGAAVGSGPNIMVSTWAAVDLGSAVSGNGTYSFAVTTTRTANNQFGSRESGYAPKLVVTTNSASSPTPTPTSSASTPVATPGGTVTATGGAVQSAMIGTTFAAPLTAQVSDASGQPVANAAVTFTAPASGASASFPGGASTVTVTTDSQGLVSSPPITANATTGSYVFTASTNGGQQAGSFSLTNTDPTIVAAGDIACTAGSTASASSCQQLATSDLAITLRPDAVLPLGDDQYELGSLSDYQSMYDPSWGRLNAISYPVPGNHEYGYIGSSVQPTGGTGYFTYFGDRSHPLQPGCTSLCTSWYSYNLGTWHVIALDSQCAVISGCNPGNPEYNWLQSDLKANAAKCTLAYWHIPTFSSSQDHQPDMQAIYGLLYSKGADVVLTGHAHFYERFAPQDSTGTADPVNGITEFVVGSGGRSFFPISATPAANSAARIANTFGVLQMTLFNGGYSWNFVAANGGSATDSGSATCH